MKSSRKAPTPEREGLVLQAKEEGKAVGFVQKEHIKVHGQLCNASKNVCGRSTILRLLENR